MVFSMSDHTEREVREIKGQYAGFINRRLEDFWVAWDPKGDDSPVLCLERCLRFILFAPIEMKEALVEEAKRIKKELNDAYKVDGVDSFTSQIARNAEAWRVANKNLPGFLDQLNRWFDKRGYMEVIKEFRKGSFREHK